MNLRALLFPLPGSIGLFVRFLTVGLALLVVAAACSSPVTIASDEIADSDSPTSSIPPDSVSPSSQPPATSAAPESTVPETTASTTSQPATTSVPLASVASVATLIEAGAEPRQELRFDYTDGQTFGADIEMSQTISQVIDGVAPAAAPVTKTTTGAVGTVTITNGNFVLESTTDSVTSDIEGDPALNAQVQATLDQLLGLVERRVIDPTGVVLDFSLTGVTDIDPAIMGPAAQAGENGVALAFPIEAIGIGGIWETIAVLAINGLAVEQVTRYEVLRIDGDIVELAVTTTQFVAPGSAMDIPGAEATVDAWSAIGTGTLTVDVTTPAPTGQIALQASQELTIVAGNDEVVIVQDITTETTTTPR